MRMAPGRGTVVVCAQAAPGAATTTAALDFAKLRHAESGGQPATGWPLNREKP